MSVRILFVDPCPIIHAGVADILRGTEFRLVLATTSVRAAIEYMDTDSEIIVLCDFEFEDGSANDLQKIASRMRIPLLLFSEWQNPVFVSRMAEQGAFGLIAKSASAEELVTSLQHVKSGKKLWQRQDSRRFTGALSTPRLNSHIDFPLTQREFEVLKEMASGQTNKMVAERLGISYETVKEHMQNVIVKLGVNDRTQAAILAVRRGLI